MEVAPTVTPRRRRALRFVAWTVFTFGVLETVARATVTGPFPCLRPSADPAMVFELRPGRYVSDGYLEHLATVTYDIDARGCRVAEARTASGGGPSALFFGSSLGFGFGVPQHRTFPAVARERLAARGRPLDAALSCSVPGHHLLQGIRTAERVMPRDRPSLVVFVVSTRHLRKVFDWSQLIPRRPWMAWLTAHVRLARVAWIYALQKRSGDFFTGFEPAERIEAGLDRLARALRPSGSRAVFFLVGAVEHPTLRLPEALAARGLRSVTLSPLPNLPRWTLDGEHWSAEGHAVIGTQMADALDRVLAEPAPPPARSATEPAQALEPVGSGHDRRPQPARPPGVDRDASGGGAHVVPPPTRDEERVARTEPRHPRAQPA